MAAELPPPLVIRFGRLGDLVLITPALASLARRGGPVDVVTSDAYRGLLESLPWVRRVWSLRGLGGGEGAREVLALAGQIRRAGHGPVVDLHGSLRSRLLAAALGGAMRRVVKGSLRRRLRVGVRLGGGRARLGATSALPSFPGRYLATVGAGPDEPELPRWPLANGRPGRGEPPVLALLPGARTATKRWPPERFGALARLWRDELGGPSRVFHGPGEEGIAEAVLAASGGAAARCEELELTAVVQALAGCPVAVGGDTGLLHLAAAAGARPVGLFGPTAADTGYWPWSTRGRALVPALPCHPCSLYGAERCPLEHHECLRGLEPGAVLAAARELLERRSG